MPDIKRLMRPLQAADPAGDAVRRVIKAYHGSPYDFDAFDASKIGTGEGAQSYGHGLYFAGSEPVADVYRTSVSALKRTPQEDALEFWRRHAEISGNKQKAVLDALDHAEGSLDEAAGMPEAEQRWMEIIQHLYELDYRRPLPKRPGHMYEVEIGYPEEALLDWDAPMSRQPQRVLDALARGGLTARTLPPERWLGRDAYHAAVQAAGSDTGAAAIVRGEGIPGIRYLDQGSRAAGEGTRNYVMFPGTEDRIRILRKFGLLAPMGAGMMGGEE